MHAIVKRMMGGGLVLWATVTAVIAQAGPPALSTNPGTLAIFPAKGQSPEQQKPDEAAAYDWATKQTGWDPYQAKAALDQQAHASAAAAGAARGGAVKGAAGGALAGAAIGVIAGDAGKGAAIGSAVAVDEDGTVGPPDLGDRERPTFFRVDAEKKELTLLGPDSRRGEVTKLESVQEMNGQHVFSGVENGRFISVIITKDGRMTLSIISDGVVWSVFGHALRDEDRK